MDPAAKQQSVAALVCTDIVKRFGTNVALNRASLRVNESEIHALVGENGAGKSTLIGVISGLLKPDSGEVEVRGTRAQFKSPLDAVAAGIGVVHQHFMLADALTVAENVALGARTSPLGWRFDRKTAEANVAELAAKTGLAINPAACVGDLPVGLRQRVEILKALSRGARILLLDEPTAVLAPPEVRALFETLRGLRASGRTIVVVTHKLDEVFALASSVTVLRRGATTHSGPLSDLTAATLAEKMIGRTLVSNAETDSPSKAANAEPVLSVRNVIIPGTLKIERLDVHAGEIVGIAGVEGNGQEELAATIAGTLPYARSPQASPPEILLRGKSLADASVRERSDAGLAYIPSDRQHEGLILDFTLSENLHSRAPITYGGAGVEILNHSKMRTHCAELLTAYGAVPPEPALPARALSGGNQQKVVIARELSRSPALILACNPTRGLDVGAAADVYQRLRDAARAQHAGVLLISSDLDEVLQLADRVCVLYRGEIREVGPRGVTREEVGRAMVGA